MDKYQLIIFKLKLKTKNKKVDLYGIFQILFAVFYFFLNQQKTK